MPKSHKYPSHLYTLVIDLGPNLAAFQQHHADEGRAKRALLELKDRMNRAGGKCIENVQLWHNNSLIKSFAPNPPVVIHLPPPDANGVRHLPERGRRRLPSIKPYHPPGRTSDLDI